MSLDPKKLLGSTRQHYSLRLPGIRQRIQKITTIKLNKKAKLPTLLCNLGITGVSKNPTLLPLCVLSLSVKLVLADILESPLSHLECPGRMADATRMIRNTF